MPEFATFDCLALSALEMATPMPAKRVVRSTAVPIPTDGGILSSPVMNETVPVPASASTKGSEVIANAIVTAFLSFPPLPSSLRESSDSAGSGVRR